jgi:hypothetical protein
MSLSRRVGKPSWLNTPRFNYAKTEYAVNKRTPITISAFLFIASFNMNWAINHTT